MIIAENIDDLNKRLKREFGCCAFTAEVSEGLEEGKRIKKAHLIKIPDTRPLFRVIWAGSEREKRKGTFCDFVAGIQVREVTEIRDTLKYPYIKDKYVLERLVYSPVKELVQSDVGHYELLWTFQDAKGNYLPPIWRACEKIIYAFFNQYVRTQSELIDDEKKEEAVEVEEFDLKLREMGMEKNLFALKHGEAVGYGVKR